MNWEVGTDIYTPRRKADSWWEAAQEHREVCDVLDGGMRGWNGGRKGASAERGYKDMYGGFTLLYSRNQHNFAKQLYPNKR